MDSVRLKATLQLRYPATIFAITIHGLRPLLLVGNSLHLIDKNVVARMRASSISDADRYWLEMLNSQGRKINPILCAFEGQIRSVPSEKEFWDELVRSCEDVSRLLPKADVVTHLHDQKSGLYSLVQDLSDRYQREHSFLLEVAPSLLERASDTENRLRNERLISIAERLGIARRSLAVVAALSCLNESKSGDPPSPARRVLKPAEIQKTQNAHNALADLRALEFLIAGHAHGLGDAVLCTADRPLGRFWRTLGFKGARASGRTVTYGFDFSSELLPRLSATEIEGIAQRLAAATP